jgi:hypothetical protein
MFDSCITTEAMDRIQTLYFSRDLKQDKGLLRAADII